MTNYSNIIKSTGTLTEAHKIFEMIQCRELVHGKHFILKSEAANDYDKEELPVIPANTTIIVDFGGDFGLYGIAEINGHLKRIKLKLEDVTKLDFGIIPDNILDIIKKIEANRKKEHYYNEESY